MTNIPRKLRRWISDEEMITYMLTLPPAHHPSLDAVRGAADHYDCSVSAANRAYGRVLDSGALHQVKIRHGLTTVLYAWRRAGDTTPVEGEVCA